MRGVRETNHLRKYANEAGKKMRGPRRHRPFRSINLDDPQCSRCGYRQTSHYPTNPDYEHSRKSGMCEQFQAKGE